MKQQNPLTILSNQGNEQSSIIIDKKQLDYALFACEALDNKIRQRILDIIEELGEFSTINHISEKLRLEKDVTQKHLRILKRVKVIIPEKNEFNQLVYWKNHQELARLAKFIHDLTNY